MPTNYITSCDCCTSFCGLLKRRWFGETLPPALTLTITSTECPAMDGTFTLNIINDFADGYPQVFWDSGLVTYGDCTNTFEWSFACFALCNDCTPCTGLIPPDADITKGLFRLLGANGLCSGDETGFTISFVSEACEDATTGCLSGTNLNTTGNHTFPISGIGYFTMFPSCTGTFCGSGVVLYNWTLSIP